MFCRFNSELRSRLGVELAVAHFILKGGGAVKFEGSEDWLDLQENPPWKRNVDRILPTQHAPAYKIEAIDASRMPIMYDTFDSFSESLYFIIFLFVIKYRHFDFFHMYSETQEMIANVSVLNGGTLCCCVFYN